MLKIRRDANCMRFPYRHDLRVVEEGAFLSALTECSATALILDPGLG